jgi:NCAIR mutase (PurE)-related protein
MDPKRLEELLASLAAGQLSVDDAITQLKSLPFTELGMAKPDMHRALRQGVPETIFCQGKTAKQVAAIAGSLLEVHESVIATRCDAEHLTGLEYNFSALVKYHPEARIAVIGNANVPTDGRSLFHTYVVTAGTADLPVAEESAVILEHLGFPVKRLYDVGVAGLHRILSEVSGLQSASCVIAVAGMDGALPSVIGGLVPCPVIAVPTSIGYGANFGGIAPLLTMLNSCAHGLTVVNIDNGFGAAMAVHRIFLSVRHGL